MSGRGDRDNLRGGAWLIADMSLNIWALSIVKWLGAGYPSTQIVFLRALVGLLLAVPTTIYPRVVRGGSWAKPMERCTVTYRDRSMSGLKHFSDVGFRIVLAPPLK